MVRAPGLLFFFCLSALLAVLLLTHSLSFGVRVRACLFVVVCVSVMVYIALGNEQ